MEKREKKGEEGKTEEDLESNKKKNKIRNFLKISKVEGRHGIPAIIIQNISHFIALFGLLFGFTSHFRYTVYYYCLIARGN